MQLRRAYVPSTKEFAFTLTRSSFSQHIFRGRMTLMRKVSAFELGFARASTALTAAFQLFRRRQMGSLPKFS